MTISLTPSADGLSANIKLNGVDKVTVTGDSGTNIVGTTTINPIPAGCIGEYLEAEVLVGDAVALTNSVQKTVASITLTAGDWDVWGVAAVNCTLVTTTGIASTISLINNTFPDHGRYNKLVYGAISSFSSVIDTPTPMTRVSVSSPTTVYLVSSFGFSAGSAIGFGVISARRVR